MHRCLYLLLGLVVAFALALPATAAADITLGTTAQPAGSSPGNCAAGYMIGQETSDPSTPDTVPPPGGQITGWQTNTTGDTAGSGLTLVVLRPNEGAYTVVGVDPEVLPTPLPTDGIATFTLPTPLQVQSGDVLSLYSFNGVGNCAWGGVSDAADRISLFMLAVAPGPADSETPLANASGYLLDVAATLAPSDVDAGVTTSVGPSGATAGHPALLISTVVNNGPASAPITFTDQVPAGLTINSAAAGDGTCSTSGQTVTCTITGLPAGQSVPVEVIATPSAAGSYTNSVSIALNAGASDPNPTNNTAAATLSVASGAPPAKCVVPALRAVPSGLARTVLNDLGCKVKTAKAHSQSIRKGTVVSTNPGHGTYASGVTITLIISSGPKKHK
ncbi:MAG: PASTA domain-containing protein [Solirubrobacteraceae bacterium]